MSTNPESTPSGGRAVLRDSDPLFGSYISRPGMPIYEAARDESEPVRPEIVEFTSGPVTPGAYVEVEVFTETDLTGPDNG